MQNFCEGELTKDVMDIEHQLGVTRVGKRSDHGMSGLWPHFRPPREEEEYTNALLDQPTVINSMTVRINTQYTKVIFTKRSPSWNLEASQFLLGLRFKELNTVYSTSEQDDFLNESLEFNMELQLNVVC